MNINNKIKKMKIYLFKLSLFFFILSAINQEAWDSNKLYIYLLSSF